VQQNRPISEVVYTENPHFCLVYTVCWVIYPVFWLVYPAGKFVHHNYKDTEISCRLRLRLWAALLCCNTMERAVQVGGFFWEQKKNGQNWRNLGIRGYLP